MDAVLVTPDNFARAETDRYLATVVGQAGGPGRFVHRRDLTSVREQHVVRANRDTVYSSAVFDLHAAPARITVPDPGDRFLSVIVIDQDHYVHAVTYGGQAVDLDATQFRTRYVLVGLRILADPKRPGDLEAVHALQDAVTVEQADTGTFDTPTWDETSRARVRQALVRLAATVPDAAGMFGARHDVDPVRHLVGTATGWGGNPERDATYLTVTPDRNDGTVVHGLVVGDVPVDAFWSITVYNAQGYLQPNEPDTYSVNSVTAAREPDGTVAVRFGGRDSHPNRIPITPGWNYWVRLYRPRPEVLSGAWRFPTACPVDKDD